MEAMYTPEEVAELVESSTGTVTFENNSSGRLEYRYEGAVNAHYIPSSYNVIGFGKGWFALEREAHYDK